MRFASRFWVLSCNRHLGNLTAEESVKTQAKNNLFYRNKLNTLNLIFL